MNPRYRILLILSLFGLSAVPAAADLVELRLDAVQAPERQRVEVDLTPAPLAAGARAVARLEARQGQTRIEVSFRELKPAVLYGGDVTSYVLWAIARDGKSENLGELWVRSEQGTARFTTGQKDFALLVTAESHYLVDQPSTLVVFSGERPKNRRVTSHPFHFSDFAPAPARGVDDVSNVSYSGSTPVDLLQAERVLDLARRSGAGDFAPDRLREAGTALAQARNYYKGGVAEKRVVDYARRSVALSSEAMRLTSRAIAERDRQAEEAQRQAELEALESRASGAEAAYLEAEAEKARLQEQIEGARQTLDALAGDRQRLSDEIAELDLQRGEFEAAMASLRQESAAAEKQSAEAIARLSAERAELESTLEHMAGDRDQLSAQAAEMESQVALLEEQRLALESTNRELEATAGQLQDEKNRLESRLQSALGQVADTRQSARGLVVSLPDILFDIDRATLKPAATLALAKLSGILALMPELNLRIEGHTDSTGGREHNQRLSEERSRAVSSFLSEQGVVDGRLTATGYGMDRPVADNTSREGRAKNRRVEIVIAEGEIEEAAASGS